MTDQPAQKIQRILPPGVTTQHFDAITIAHTGDQCFIEILQYDWTVLADDNRQADTAIPAIVIARYAVPPLQATILSDNTDLIKQRYIESGKLRPAQPNLRSVR